MVITMMIAMRNNFKAWLYKLHMWEIAIAVGIPAVGVAIAGGRYLWKKEKCFIALQNAVKTLMNHDVGSDDLHIGFDERLTNIEDKQIKQEIYLKLLLDHSEIPYNP